MTDTLESDTSVAPNGQNGQDGNGQSSLATKAARNLATTTKTPPQMQGITVELGHVED